MSLATWRPQSRIVGLWHLDGNSTDSSGSGYNGSDTAISYSSSYGLFNQGGSFNGSTSFISCAGPSLANATFSIATWSKKSATGLNNRYICGIHESGNTNKSLHFGWRDENTITLAFWSNDLDYDVTDNTNWNFIVATYNSSTKLQQIYYNGEFGASRTASANFSGSANFWIGKAITANPFSGYIDEVAVFNTVLTAKEIRYMYGAKRGKLD